MYAYRYLPCFSFMAVVWLVCTTHDSAVTAVAEAPMQAGASCPLRFLKEGQVVKIIDDGERTRVLIVERQEGPLLSPLGEIAKVECACVIVRSYTPTKRKNSNSTKVEYVPVLRVFPVQSIRDIVIPMPDDDALRKRAEKRILRAFKQKQE